MSKKKEHVCNGPNCDHRAPIKGNWMRIKDPLSLDRQTEEMSPTPDSEQIEALISRLISFGLKPWEAEVLINRDVLKLKLSEIADLGGYTSAGAVHRIYKLAADKAKRGYRGFLDG